MSRTTSEAMLRCARSCIAEARSADARGQHSYAAEMRGAAYRALAEHDAATPRAVDPETAAARAQTRAFVQVVLQGFGQTQH